MQSKLYDGFMRIVALKTVFYKKRGNKHMKNFKINLLLRLQNKVTLVTLLTAFIALGYQLLGLFGVVPRINQNELTSVVVMAVNILVMLGIVVDPTTKGIGDSDEALMYNRPK